MECGEQHEGIQHMPGTHLHMPGTHLHMPMVKWHSDTITD